MAELISYMRQYNESALEGEDLRFYGFDMQRISYSMRFVGPSGSGKSTISKLIARFWDIQKGKITIGGKDIKAMEPESLL